MSAEGNREQFRLGFLTAVEVPQRGYVGGLLVTNHFGRPLEFQCTTPVQPNRTQEILYGPTLVPFILGELIGRTLVEKVGVRPDVLLTDSVDLLGLREHVSLPVAWVESTIDRSVDEDAKAATPAVAELATHAPPAGAEAPPERSQGFSEVPGISDAADTSNADLATAETSPVESHVEPQPDEQEEPSLEGEAMNIGRQVLRFHEAHPADRAAVSQKLHLVPREADLLEPFERVREALKESTGTGAAP